MTKIVTFMSIVLIIRKRIIMFCKLLISCTIKYYWKISLVFVIWHVYCVFDFGFDFAFPLNIHKHCSALALLGLAAMSGS